MEDQNFGIKELYSISIKAISDMSFNGRNVKKGQPLIYFDNVKMAEINEYTTPIYARGGRGNPPLVIWQNRNQANFVLSAGILNETSLSLLTGAFGLPHVTDQLFVPVKDIIELDDSGKGQLSHQAVSTEKPIFCFLYSNSLIQKRVQPTSVDINGEINFGEDYSGKTILVDYYFTYDKQKTIYTLDKNRFGNAFSLEAKFYRKGETDGLLHTSLLIMPKIRILSNINITLGTSVSPSVSTFNITALPSKTIYSDSSIMQIYNLEQDVG